MDCEVHSSELGHPAKTNLVQQVFRDAKLCEIGEGTSEIQRLVIARELLRGS